MDEAKARRWCSEVCGAKCCTLHLREEPEPIPCPRLKADNSCSVYAERYKDGAEDLVVVGYWQSRRYKNLDQTLATRPFFCGRIHQIIERGGLSPEVREGCCYAHPELLENYET